MTPSQHPAVRRHPTPSTVSFLPATAPRALLTERLLHVDRRARSFTDRAFAELPSLLRAGDLLVVNDAATLPASLELQNRDAELRLLAREREAGLVKSLQPDDTRSVGFVALHEELERLPEKYRVPLILHHLEGWSEDEVARMLNLKLGTLSGQLARGRGMLRERLHRRGLASFAAAIVAGALLVPADIAAAAQGFSAAQGAGSAHVQALSGGAVRDLALARRVTVTVSAAAAVVVLLIGGWLLWSMMFDASSAAGANAKTGAFHGVVTGPSGRRLANAIRANRYPRSGESISAASLVFSRAAEITDAFDRGVLIRSKHGLWLASRRPRPGPVASAGRGSRPFAGSGAPASGCASSSAAAAQACSSPTTQGSTRAVPPRRSVDDAGEMAC